MLNTRIYAALECIAGIIVDVLIVFVAIPVATLLCWGGLWREKRAARHNRPDNLPLAG